MACFATRQRRELGLKALNVQVSQQVARHIAVCAAASGLRQSAWMARVLAEGKPFPIEEDSKPAPALKLVEPEGA